MKTHKRYQSTGGSGTSVANKNIIQDHSRIKNVIVSVDCDCAVSFNHGEFIPVKGGSCYYFSEFCSSIVMDADGVVYSYSGEIKHCLMAGNAGKGEKGASAYEIAVANGFVGAEPEWLESLKAVGETSVAKSGEIFWWPLTTPPDGSLVCDGSAISRETYSKLFGVIGTLYGAGDNATTFNLPDLRGEFVRGYDPGAKRDPQGSTRKLGTHQDATIVPRMDARIETNNTAWVNLVYGNRVKGIDYITTSNSDGGFYEGKACIDFGSCTPATTTNLAGGISVRPTNVSLLPCIRY